MACRVLALGCRAFPGGSVEVARRVIPRLGLAVTPLGLTVTNVGRTVAVTPIHVALAWVGEGGLALFRDSAVLIWGCHTAVQSFVHTGLPGTLSSARDASASTHCHNNCRNGSRAHATAQVLRAFVRLEKHLADLTAHRDQDQPHDDQLPHGHSKFRLTSFHRRQCVEVVPTRAYEPQATSVGTKAGPAWRTGAASAPRPSCRPSPSAGR